MDIGHIPVMQDEVVRLLQPAGTGWIVDGSLGLGGHAEAVLDCESFEGRLLGVDRDEDALEKAGRRLDRFGDRFVPCHAAFARLPEALEAHGIDRADGLLLDLGVSSMQLDVAERGFSFMNDGPLDMRMDPTTGPTAREMISRLNVKELERVLREYGEERYAKRIARAIVDARGGARLQTTGELADVIARAVRRRPGSQRLHPATRSFQALRLLVNDEIGQLEAVMATAPQLLAPSGRIVVLSYHSLEDRVVKHTLRDQKRDGLWEILTRKPMRPRQEEVDTNPRSRSAKLRAAIRTEQTTDTTAAQGSRREPRVNRS